MTLGSGGGYEFEFNSANATPGSGADFTDDTGTLTITAGTTSNSVFTIGLLTLNAANQPAALTDFDPTQGYSFTLITAAGGISGFAPDKFSVDTSGFQNNTQDGNFTVVQSGNTLLLNFSPNIAPTPEPSSVAVFALGALGLLELRRRRRACA